MSEPEERPWRLVVPAVPTEIKPLCEGCSCDCITKEEYEHRAGLLRRWKCSNCGHESSWKLVQPKPESSQEER